MKKEFPFVKIPEELLEMFGEADKGTRMYRKYGSEDDFDKWFDAVIDVTQKDGGTVSPGGAAMYAKVSRPAVHKRLKEGRLTAFCFHLVENSKFFKDRKTLKDGGMPTVSIPVSECRAWAEILKNRKDRKAAYKEATEGSWNQRFLKAPRKLKKKVRKEK
jgi:hypothetical protein